MELKTPVEIKCDENNLNSLTDVRTRLGWSVIGPENDIEPTSLRILTLNTATIGSSMRCDEYLWLRENSQKEQRFLELYT